MSIGHNSAAVITPDADEGTLFHYISLHIGDWMGGTAGMTPEQEGAYLRFLLHLYQRGKPLPDDDRFMSRVMSLSLRVWKRLKDQLVSLGKIVIRSGALTNSRFEKERQKRAEEMRKRSVAAQTRWAKSRKVSLELAPNLDETSAKLPAKDEKKPNKNNDPLVQMDMLSRIQYPESNIQSVVRHSPEQLLQKLQEAGGEALANYAASPGLLMVTEPMRWIENGCDLELDILPTLRARALRSKPRSIRAWGYFTQAVLDAHATRTAPLPKGQAATQPNGNAIYARNGVYAGKCL
jgi:uncharacterized protein YdaU (DUF1376 family)